MYVKIAIVNAIFQDLERFAQKRGFSKWLCKGCGFLFGEILKYPRIDITCCRIKHRICNVCSFYFLLCKI